MAEIYVDNYEDVAAIHANVGDIVHVAGIGLFTAIASVLSADSGAMQVHVPSSSARHKYYPPKKGRGGKLKKY